MSVDLRTRRYDFEDPRLQRHVVHDPRSLDFRLDQDVNEASWRDRSVAIYDPKPNPNQVLGNCTAVSKAVQFNAAGNRRKGVVLDMAWATELYKRETQIDPFRGTYPPDDTGSNGLAACKAAAERGDGGEYRWLTSWQGVVEANQSGWAVSVGTRWDNQMFNQDAAGFIYPGGSVAGGHQWTVKGSSARGRYIVGLCWWGRFRLFKMRFADFAELLADDGDAHVQRRVLA